MPTTSAAPAGSDVYERLRSDVIEAGLCTHCGTCAGVSGGAIEMRATTRGPLPHLADGARGSDVPAAAYQACPGRGLHYPSLYEFLFGQREPSDWLMGPYRQLYVGYATAPDVRRGAASGGVITQALLHLLDTGRVDGVIALRLSEERPWEGEPFIARTAEELGEAAQSVYVPSPVNTILPEVECFEGTLAYVGLPDQVASLRRLQQLGHGGAKRIDYVFGPYTGTAMYEGALASYLRSNGHAGGLAEIADLKYREGEWPGYLQITTKSGEVLRAEKFYYNYLIPFYITQASLLGVDFTNELTDVSVGDAWHPRYEAQGQGFSVVAARTEKGESLLDEMKAAGLVSLEKQSASEATSMHGHMIDFKKRGAFVRIGWRRALGKKVPRYGYRPVRLAPSRQAAEVVISVLFAVCGTRLARRLVEYVPLDVLGPLFNTLRKSWKGLSKPAKREGLREQPYEALPPDAADLPTGISESEGRRVRPKAERA